MSIALATAAEAPRRVEPILRSVSEWFGIEAATRMYIDMSGKLPTHVARLGGRDAGFLTVARHFRESAEVYCMAVAKDFHGTGIGTALLRHVETALAREGTLFLQVKTQGPSKPNAGYARTLHFYETRGFTRLEEISGLWPGIPCLMLVKRLGEK